jgi:hypothetical protein
MVGKRTLQPTQDRAENGDLESGRPNKRFAGFKDAVEYAIDRRTTIALKEQLRNGVDRREFEIYRKSDEEVGKLVGRRRRYAD